MIASLRPRATTDRPVSFSYQVSQLILAHVTKSPFPYWNGMMVYSLFGALDANARYLFNRCVIPSFLVCSALHRTLTRLLQ